MHVIGTAGHVDHGKSTLVEALTGMDPDRFEEEKRRGLTIDLGFAWFTLPSGAEVGIVDVPGHERFIRNMLAGVGGIDAALFVVAADEGWMPQSAEHLQILDFLEIRRGVIVLTKADLAPPDMLAFVRSDVVDRLVGTGLEGAPIVTVSAVTGDGLEELRRTIDEVLVTTSGSVDRGRPRLFADRSFTITGAGTVVTGTLTGGRFRVDDEIELLPSGHRARIRSLQTHRRDVEEAAPGSRVAANLVGLEKEEVARGDAIVLPGQWQPTDTFAARLRTSRDLEHPVAERGAYELHVGATEVPCRLKFLEEPPPHEGRIPTLPPGTDLLVQVFCARPVPLDIGDRFIIRDIGRWETVAGGAVLDHMPGRTRRGDPELLEQLRARESATGEDLVAQLVTERKLVARDELSLLAGAGPLELEDAVGRAVATGRVIATTGFVIDARYAGELKARAREALTRFHAEHRLEPGMPRQALRRALGLEAKTFAQLLELWNEDGTVVAEGTVCRLPTHGIQMDAADREAADRALGTLREADVSPPDVADLGLSHELLKALERTGELVFVSPQIAYAAEVMRRIEKSVVHLIRTQGPATVAQVRDAIGTTRKYAVPLLEYLDASGVTRRRDDKRILGPRGEEIAEQG